MVRCSIRRRCNSPPLLYGVGDEGLYTPSVKMMKAFKTLVNLGAVSLEMVMDDKKQLYVSAQQFHDLTSSQAHQYNSARTLKTLLGKDSKYINLTVEGTKTPSLVLTITQFEVALAKLAFSSNLKAQDLIQSLAGLSLVQAGYDAFGVKFETQGRLFLR